MFGRRERKGWEALNTGIRCPELMSQAGGEWERVLLQVFEQGKVGENTGMSRFITAHRCGVFYKLKTRPSTYKKIVICFMVILIL